MCAHSIMFEEIADREGAGANLLDRLANDCLIAAIVFIVLTNGVANFVKIGAGFMEGPLESLSIPATFHRCVRSL